MSNNILDLTDINEESFEDGEHPYFCRCDACLDRKELEYDSGSRM